MGFSERLKALRTKRGISQADFANDIGVSKSAISMYENGQRTPDYETLGMIADYFNESVDYLLGRAGRDVDYLDTEVLELANELQERPDLRVLMDASRDLTSADMFTIVDTINKLKKHISR